MGVARGDRLPVRRANLHWERPGRDAAIAELAKRVVAPTPQRAVRTDSAGMRASRAYHPPCCIADLNRKHFTQRLGAGADLSEPISAPTPQGRVVAYRAAMKSAAVHCLPCCS